MAGELAGKIALITGAARGIGLETGRQLGALGAVVLLGDLSKSEAEAAAGQLVAEGIDSLGIALDVTSEDDREAAYQFVRARFGVLDILVNNAGICLEPEYSVPEGTSGLPIDTLRQTMEVNFFAPFLLTQKFLPLIRKSAAGRIVNVSSMQASLTTHADPSDPQYGYKIFAYDTSKTALNSFTVHLAHELRDTAIKVNSAHPGWVQTDMGGDGATDNLAQGCRTSVRLATLDADGPTGGFFFVQDRLPW